MVRAAVVCLAVIAATAGCSRDLAGGSVDGETVFATACAPCHGEGGKPPEALRNQLGVRDLTAPEFRSRATLALIEHQVRAGSENQKMPAFQGALSDAQITAVAAFVMGLGGEPPPPPPR
jgi:mono/diheme cytochrome c family protein